MAIKELMVQRNKTIDFLELQVLASVVRHGGLTAAAEAIGVSKSTVSLQITRLENRLGTQLLKRSSRRVALTPEGEQLMPRIESLLSEADQLLATATQSNTAPRGTVRIALTPALGGAVLEVLVPALAESHPGIALVVLPSYDMEDLQDPAFDFAIRIGQVHDERLVASSVGSFERILVATPSHAGAWPGSIDDLPQAPLLSNSGRSTHIDWHLFCEERPSRSVRLDADAKVSVRDFDLLLRLARSGHGIAWLPDFMVRSDLAEGRLVRILPQWRSEPMNVMLTYRPGVSRIGRVAAVLEQTRLAVTQVLQKGLR